MTNGISLVIGVGRGNYRTLRIKREAEQESGTIESGTLIRK